MNKLKDNCKDRGLNYFLTYADNNAIGYFKKQGFSTSIKMNMEKWKEYIKDYDGGTLMEAYCNPMIDYSNLSDTIKCQKETLKKIIGSLLGNKTKCKYSQLETIAKKFKLDQNSEQEKDKSLINEDDFYKIPGIEQADWEYEDYKKLFLDENSNITLYSQCRNIITKIKNNKNAWPFLKPVDEKEVPDYYNVIKEPMGKYL